MHLLCGVFASSRNVLRMTSVCDDDVIGSAQNDGESVSESSSAGGSYSGSGSNSGSDSGSGRNDENALRDYTRTEGQSAPPKVMITLLLSQAIEWELEKLGRINGFQLSAIIPFEDLIFSTYGYSRKRTYVDDIFPSSSPLITGAVFTDKKDIHGQMDAISIESLSSLQKERWKEGDVIAWTFIFELL